MCQFRVPDHEWTKILWPCGEQPTGGVEHRTAERESHTSRVAEAGLEPRFFWVRKILYIQQIFILCTSDVAEGPQRPGSERQSVPVQKCPRCRRYEHGDRHKSKQSCIYSHPYTPNTERYLMNWLLSNCWFVSVEPTCKDVFKQGNKDFGPTLWRLEIRLTLDFILYTPTGHFDFKGCFTLRDVLP